MPRAASPALPEHVIGIVTSPTGTVSRHLHRLEDQLPDPRHRWPVPVRAKARGKVAEAIAVGAWRPAARYLAPTL